jgi:hypothetical protein
VLQKLGLSTVVCCDGGMSTAEADSSHLAKQEQSSILVTAEPSEDFKSPLTFMVFDAPPRRRVVVVELWLIAELGRKDVNTHNGAR